VTVFTHRQDHRVGLVQGRACGPLFGERDLVGRPARLPEVRRVDGELLIESADGLDCHHLPESIVAQWSTDDTFLFAAAGAVMAVGVMIDLFIFRLRRRVQPS